MATPAEPPVPPTPAPPPPRRYAAPAAAAAFVVALIGCIAAYLAYTAPGAWLKTSETRVFAPDTFTVTAGAAGAASGSGGTLSIAPDAATGTVIVSLKANLRAADYRGVAWDVTGIPDGTEARLLWRNDVKPGRNFTLPFSIAGDRLLSVATSDDPNWFGRVTGLAFALKLPPGAAPIRVGALTVQPLSAAGVFAARWNEWTTFEPWTGASINALVGGANLQELPPALPLAAALVLAFALLLGIARWKPTLLGAGVPAALGALFVASWWLLDLRWQWNLARQAGATAGQYAGKDLRDKHLAAEDAALYAFVQKALPLLPPAPARVFVAADEHYFRDRAAWHLYPRNVWFTPYVDALPPAGALRPGDCVVIFQRRGVQYDRAQQRLRLGEPAPIAAEALLVDGGGAVFRIL